MRLSLSVALSAALLAACGGGGGSSMTAPTNPNPSPTPSPSPDPAVPPSPPAPAGTTLIRMAALRGANGHSASGTARIVRNGGSFVLELGNDFRIDSGNNDVYLTRNSNTIAGSDLNLGNMKATTGAQSYEMPNDGGAYGYVMLWCRPFRVPIGVGELR